MKNENGVGRAVGARAAHFLAPLVSEIQGCLRAITSGEEECPGRRNDRSRGLTAGQDEMVKDLYAIYFQPLQDTGNHILAHANDNNDMSQLTKDS